ncbi:unnamed protein product [Rotaria sordida]|uniref:6-phosphofructo-2-kinase domain-containing protein n=1 Tax=Rotaria sordida TaxID=392033 RepID=A0A818XV83_9BILA|nr:unnamed protein product [Rotaria sordida]
MRDRDRDLEIKVRDRDSRPCFARDWDRDRDQKYQSRSTLLTIQMLCIRNSPNQPEMYDMKKLEQTVNQVETQGRQEVENDHVADVKQHSTCRDRLVQTPTVIMMVGLPARGKTYMSRKLARYLHWIGIKTKDISQTEAVTDFLSRIKLYEKQYEPIDDKIEEKHYSFIKIYNCGERFLVHKLGGNIQSRVVYFLMNIHVLPRTIYLTMYGESENNIQHRIGGNSPLSPAGKAYSEALAHYIASENIQDLIVWTSQMQPAIDTAKKINAPKEQWKALNGISAGIFEGLTYQEVAENYPEEFAVRNGSKYYYRYPGGESYHDVIARLEPVIMELERAENVLVITHQAVIRCILAYFLDKDPERLPYMKVPLHTVIKLTPMAYGCMMERIPLSVEAVNINRSKLKYCEPNRAGVKGLNEFLGVRSEAKIGPRTTQIFYQNAGTTFETTDARGNRLQRLDSTMSDVTSDNNLSPVQDSDVQQP